MALTPFSVFFSSFEHFLYYDSNMPIVQGLFFFRLKLLFIPFKSSMNCSYAYNITAKTIIIKQIFCKDKSARHIFSIIYLKLIEIES